MEGRAGSTDGQDPGVHRVNPKINWILLTYFALFYPFLYLLFPSSLVFTEAEQGADRRHRMYRRSTRINLFYSACTDFFLHFTSLFLRFPFHLLPETCQVEGDG